MLCKISFATSIVAASLFFASAASAASLPALGKGTHSLFQTAQGWDVGRCRGWRRECADRHGWGGERFHRCLIRHGCERHRYGDRYDDYDRRGRGR
jgi:hypothetical protein